MDKCNDHWCEHYGNGSEKCDRCQQKDIVQDNHDLRVILRRRAIELMELDKNSSNTEEGEVKKREDMNAKFHRR